MRLIVKTGRNAGQEFPLTKGVITIGRSSVNDIVFNDEQVSRHHAEIRRRGHSFTLTDLGTVNGTFVNDARIEEPQVLRDGDRIKMGNTALSFQVAPAAATAVGTQMPFIIGGAILLIIVLVVVMRFALPPTPITPPTPTPTLTPMPTPTLTTMPAPTPTITPTSTPMVRSVQMDSLAVKQTEEEVEGVLAPIRIQIRPNPQPGEMSLAISTDEPMGIGDQWRASTWVAVLFSCVLEGVDPTEYEFLVHVGGPIDGPSASGLLTVGTLAALRGESVDEDDSMTGVINPDGSIAPVGGIPHKV